MVTRLVGNKSIGTKADSGITQKTTHTASPDRKAVVGPLPYAGRRRAYNQTSRIPITKLAGMNVDQRVRGPPGTGTAAAQAAPGYTGSPPYSMELMMRPAAKPPQSTRHLLIGS